MSSETAEAYLHEHIPVSASMGIRVVEVTDDRVELSAPLEPNLNHESTVFGGSISAVAILSAWTLLYHRLSAFTEGRRIVIQSSHMEYRKPVEGGFTAECIAPSSEHWDAFVHALERKRRARITLSVRVRSDGNVCAEFEGTYAAFT